MSRIDGTGGPGWPSSLPEDQGVEGASKSEFDKALDRQQRGLAVNPLAQTPPPELQAAQTDEDDPDKRVQPAAESGAGDNQDHGKKDPNADPHAGLDWRIRQQLGLD
ncbi:MAG: hypothetical protein KA099_06275 [Alphaproteobacteria bacterium]|nr:hypothetical protein [Alphaproteobacteria bacterium]MBP7759882.1 hypothetical protein [Alphaproteobacteria bacterium]MBP7763275.1 hypothetical protein [Alphaproteobacteria bacterium]MBP7904916.1 hypothetical protein [Alphaproteobacteria bacterium]